MDMTFKAGENAAFSSFTFENSATQITHQDAQKSSSVSLPFQFSEWIVPPSVVVNTSEGIGEPVCGLTAEVSTIVTEDPSGSRLSGSTYNDLPHTWKISPPV